MKSIQSKGKLTGVGTQVSKEASTMYIEINKIKIFINKNDIVKLEVTRDKKIDMGHINMAKPKSSKSKGKRK